MKTEWLECLVALKKYNSISKAADACFTTTQNFGKIIKNLEQEMGFTLLKRDGRNLVLTEAASNFADSAEKIIMTIEQTKLKYYENEPNVTGKIDLIVNDFDTIEFILEQFMAKYPGIIINLNEMEVSQAFQFIKKHPQTLAILPLPNDKELIHFSEYYAFLNILPLCPEQIVFLVSKYSRFANHQSIEYKDMTGEKLVVMIKSANVENYHTRFLDEFFHNKAQVAKTNSYNYFFSGISKNLFAGITIASDYSSAPYSYKDSIVAIPIKAENTSKCLVYHAQYKKFSEIEQFLIKAIEDFYHRKSNKSI